MVPVQEINLIERDANDSCIQNGYSVFASSLGENVVSFDFGPPILKSHNQSKQTNREDCLWPVYAVRGNGEVLLVYSSLKYPDISKSILGPLTMLPFAEDNYLYLADACNLLCLDCVPPLIVIATSSGILYHCVALECDDDNNHTNSLLLPQPNLFVHEIVELTLSLTSNENQDLLSPMRLYKDPISPDRFFCYHGTGAHAIWLANLTSFKTLDKNIPESFIEHLICTKSIGNISSESVIMPVGFACTLSKGHLFVKILLSSGELLSRRLPPTSIQLKISDDTDSKPPEVKVAFTEHIQRILNKDNNTPLLKTGTDKEPTSNEKLELLLNITKMMRKEYFQKIDLAATAIQKRIKALQNEKNVQLEEIERCSNEKEIIINNIEILTKKYDATLDNQDELSERISKFLVYLQRKQPELSAAEIQLKKNLETIKSKISVYKGRIEDMKTTSNYQEQMKKQSITSTKNAPSIKQIVGIREILINQ